MSFDPNIEIAMGSSKLGLFNVRSTLYTKFREYIADYSRKENGSIAVETALITPFVLFGMLVAGNLGLSVYNHQKVYTAAYSGASYLHDKIASGDLSGLNSTKNEDGEYEQGSWIQTAKLVIKDASGLPLEADKIDIQAYCACPALNPGELQNIDNEKTFFTQKSFYERENISQNQTGDVCNSKCRNGYKSRIIAEIIIDYEATSLRGGTDKVREKIVTRLR